MAVNATTVGLQAINPKRISINRAATGLDSVGTLANATPANSETLRSAANPGFIGIDSIWGVINATGTRTNRARSTSYGT